jgi:Tol biopolymer transport system component
MRRLGMVLALGMTMGLVAVATPALATYPGTNGRIAFSTDNSDDPQIFTVNPDGSGETQLTFDDSGHASAPDWSPDGKKIVFVGDATGEWQIYVMNADGSNRRQLTFDSGFDHFNPKFSPDGTKITFAGCPFQETCAIYVMNADGTNMTRLTSLVWNSGDPEFSPDGSKIAFDSNKGGFISAIWVMNANGTRQHRLTQPSLEALYPDWSPNGAHILFSDLCCLFGTNVWVMNADGTGLKQLTHFPTKHQGGFGSYSPDGKKIVLLADLKYRDNCCSDLYTMNANGAHLTRVVADQPAVFLSAWGASP